MNQVIKFFLLNLQYLVGKNDGSINGHSYFKTNPNHGIFVKLDSILNSSSESQKPLRFEFYLNIFLVFSSKAPKKSNVQENNSVDICPTCGKEAGVSFSIHKYFI